MNLEKFTDRAKGFLQSAQTVAIRVNHQRIGAEHVLKLLPKGTHEYAKFIRPSELAQWCRDAGLTLEHTRGMEYNPLTGRYWMSGDTSVNYLFGCRASVS